ncbi:hypothetical protein ACFLWB_02275 [Chloroflexota bacterium]
MKRMPIFFVMAVVMLSLVSCSGDENEAYKRGYDDGYSDGRAKHFAEGHDKGFAEGKQQGLTEGHDEGFAEGKQQGLTEGKSSLDSLVRDAYDRGYQDGATEVPETLVNVLSYNIADATTVVGELQNVSDRALNVLVIGALLDSKGEVLAVSSSLWRRYVPEQQKMNFQLAFPPPELYPADVRLNVIWY